MKPSSAMAFVSAMPGFVTSVFAASEMESLLPQPANRATTTAPHRAPQRSACVDLLTCLSSWLSWFVDRFRIGSLCRYFDATMAGGLHVPSPGGRIEGGVSFGQYRRITR